MPTGKVVCEEPNSRLHHFVGCLEWKGRKHPLDSGNMLLRGCKVRNTDTCYGLVIYTGAAAGPPGSCPGAGVGVGVARRAGGPADAHPAGFDTKIMKNCGTIRLKRTKTDRLLNRLVALVRRPGPASSGPQFPSCTKTREA